MLVHQFGGCASERCLASQRLPERHAKRVQVRADIDAALRELLRDWRNPAFPQKPQALKSRFENPVIG